MAQDDGLSRIVDRMQNPLTDEDLAWWNKLLLFQRRHHGDDGVYEIWRGFRKRGLDLPTDGVEQEYWWRTFADSAVNLAVRKRALGLKMLHEMRDYANTLYEEKGITCRHLYGMIVGRLSRENLGLAYNWHRLLQEHHPPFREDLIAILLKMTPGELTEAPPIRTGGAYQHWTHVARSLYHDFDLRDLYMDIVPRLCENGAFGNALWWHHLLLQYKDIPKSTENARPLFDFVVKQYGGKGIDEFISVLSDAQIPSGDGAIRNADVFELTRENMNILMGEVHGIKPKSFSDDLGARFFATRSFSVEMIAKGLAAFGVNEIGPKSLREIVSRDPSHETVRERIDHLSDAGISLGNSTFSKVVVSVVLKGRSDILQDLVEMDQDAEELDNWPLQEKLSQRYNANGQRTQLDRTAEIMAVNSLYPRTEQWNLALRLHINSYDMDQVARTFEAMLKERVPLSKQSRMVMHHRLLRTRRRGHRPLALESDFDDLKFVISCWQRYLTLGGYIEPDAWKEPLRRLGMTARLEELEKLSIWLCLWYSPMYGRRFRGRLAPAGKRRWEREYDLAKQIPHSDPQHPLNRLITRNLQMAIIAWGFQQPNQERPSSMEFTRQETLTRESEWLLSSSHPDISYNEHNAFQRSRMPWTRGLALLRELRNAGLHVDASLVRAVCIQRLKIIFDMGGRSNRKVNRAIRQQNNYSMHEFLVDANRVWNNPRPLFPEATSDTFDGILDNVEEYDQLDASPGPTNKDIPKKIVPI